MSKDLGRDTALDIGNKHEEVGDNDQTDLWNNCIGVDIKDKSCVFGCKKAWEEGRLK